MEREDEREPQPERQLVPLERQPPQLVVDGSQDLHQIIVQVCRRIIELETGGTEVLDLLERTGQSLLGIWRLATRCYGLYRRLWGGHDRLQGPADVQVCGSVVSMDRL